MNENVEEERKNNGYVGNVCQIRETSDYWLRIEAEWKYCWCRQKHKHQHAEPPNMNT